MCCLENFKNTHETHAARLEVKYRRRRSEYDLSDWPGLNYSKHNNEGLRVRVNPCDKDSCAVSPGGHGYHHFHGIPDPGACIHYSVTSKRFQRNLFLINTMMENTLSADHAIRSRSLALSQRCSFNSHLVLFVSLKVLFFQ